MRKFLTGNKDIDEKILLELDDKDLSHACMTNREAYRICSQQTFWRNRILTKYGADILKTKPESQSYYDFYTNKNFPLCPQIVLATMPHQSQLVFDDFYNPILGFISSSYTRDIEALNYLIPKLALERMKKDGFDNNQIIALKTKIIELGRTLPVWRDELDAYTSLLTNEEKELIYSIIDVNVDRTQLIRSYASRRPNVMRNLTPEHFKLIVKIHEAFKDKSLPLDVKWNELCSYDL